ncbi:MAG: DUF2397 family protein [Lachnospiraceae bacterium]
MHGNAEPSIRENVQGKWKALKNWFIDSDRRECECKKVLKITNDVIRSIIQNYSSYCADSELGNQQKR